MAKCQDCNREMLTARGCTWPNILLGDTWYKRSVAFWQKKGERCHDCGALAGWIHHYGCDVERCPQCGCQLITCDCAGEKIKLSKGNYQVRR